MGEICLAVDIGASSGRVIKSTLIKNRLNIEEIHRFSNKIDRKQNRCFWNVEQLFSEIIIGLKKFSNNNLEAESIGIDTWAVDYVLLDNDMNRIYPVYAYRDSRTDNTMDKIFNHISKEKIYKKTGIQFLQFNTLYQLFEHVKSNPEIENNVNMVLMIPDYLNYLLCSEAAIEYTNATTTQMYNIGDMKWDNQLLDIIGIDKNKFPKVVQPGTVIGSLSKEVKEKVNLDEVKVIAPATHDTGSAVVSVPAMDEDFAYISSGTWSLMGIENDNPICTDKALSYNFTNEGGAYNKIRVLKNIMGLWLIQEVKRLLNDKYNFGELVVLAKESKSTALINPNNSRFLNPVNMIAEIKAYCLETGQTVPSTPGDIARCIFESLALQYKQVLIELREISDKTINKIHIVGGGSQNKYLNQLCADYTECEVYSGPIEATAIGNLMVQYITLGKIQSLAKAREIINASFNIEKFVPAKLKSAEDKWNRFLELP
ncbi:rhamnulokinase [Vallitalea sediminicola]